MNSRLQLRCWICVIGLLRVIVFHLYMGKNADTEKLMVDNLSLSEGLQNVLTAERLLQEQQFEASKSDTRPLV